MALLMLDKTDIKARKISRSREEKVHCAYLDVFCLSCFCFIPEVWVSPGIISFCSKGSLTSLLEPSGTSALVQTLWASSQRTSSLASLLKGASAGQATLTPWPFSWSL